MLVSAGTLLSRVLGLVRDMCIAGLLGVGPLHDAFVVALRIPNLFRRFFAEGAFSQALVPLLVEWRDRYGVHAMAQLAFRAGVALLLVLLGLVLSLELLAAEVVALVTPGFIGEPERYDPTVEALRIMLPYLLCISLVALGSGVFNVHGRFALAAFVPVIFNLAIITGAVWVAPQVGLPLRVLSWSVLAAGVVQLLVMLVPLVRRGWLMWVRPRWPDADLARLVRLMIPGLIAGGTVQIGLLLDTVIASFLSVGSLTWLYLSERLVQFSIGIFAYPVSTVLLPSLAALFVRDRNPEAFQALLHWGIGWVLVIGIPAAMGLALLAEPVITTLFQYRNFTAVDTGYTVLSLRAYAPGLVAFMLVKVCLAGFFARQNMRTPMRVSIAIVTGNLLLSLVLVFGLGLGHVGIALASSCAASVHALVLLLLVHRSGHLVITGLGLRVFQILTATLGMAALLWYLVPNADWWQAALWYQRWCVLLALVGAGFLVYAVLLRLLGLRWGALLRQP